ALIDPRRDKYFASSAPYLTIAVGTILLTPHLDWVISHQFNTVSYAFAAHPATALTGLFSGLVFVATSLAYVAAPLVLSTLIARPSMAAIVDTAWPADAERRFFVVAFAAPLAFIIPLAGILQVGIEPLWATSAMTMLPVVLLSSPRVVTPRRGTILMLGIAVVFPVLMLALSPGITFALYQIPKPNYENHYRLFAQAVERAWHTQTDKPLRIVGGSDILNSVVFYIESEPSALNIIDPTRTPWVSKTRVLAEGMALMCPITDRYCMRAMDRFSTSFGAVITEHVKISRHFLGMEDAPDEIQIAIVLPETR
ncbi:MAG TPA: hypothetical protein VFA58_07965, partial [Chthoniobacterales bacterium]|nr:hypothetical protein [Chthoniobacterales bacterium]